MAIKMQNEVSKMAMFLLTDRLLGSWYSMVKKKKKYTDINIKTKHKDKPLMYTKVCISSSLIFLTSAAMYHQFSGKDIGFKSSQDNNNTN